MVGNVVCLYDQGIREVVCMDGSFAFGSAHSWLYGSMAPWNLHACTYSADFSITVQPSQYNDFEQTCFQMSFAHNRY